MKILYTFDDIDAYVFDDDIHDTILLYHQKILEAIKSISGEPSGFSVLFEEGDDLLADNYEANLSAQLRGIYFDYFGNGNCWEAVEDCGVVYSVLVLMNNEFGVTYWIPKEKWVPADLTEMLKHEATEPWYERK